MHLETPGRRGCWRSLFLFLACSSPVCAQTTSRVSVSTGGQQANGNFAAVASISADGRYVSFVSDASNLVTGKTNTGQPDVYVRDRQLGTTTRISVSTTGQQGDHYSDISSISADGRYIAFRSSASNLVPLDTNGYQDILLHDRQTGTTTRVSVATDGQQASGESDFPSISADGRFIAFTSYASDLVAGDTNADPGNPYTGSDVFVHDRVLGATTRVSVATGGGETHNVPYASSNPCLSADGRYVAFESQALDLVADDTNGSPDVFVHDRELGTTTRVSVPTGGGLGGDSFGPSISADGRYVAFSSFSNDLVANDTNKDEFGYPAGDVFVHDRQTGTTSRVSVSTGGGQANNASVESSISADGRYVSFTSYATDVVSGDTNNWSDVFLHDRQTVTTTRVSVSTAGVQGNLTGVDSGVTQSAISADGRFVAFNVPFVNLVSGDSNGISDIFVRGPFFTAAPYTMTDAMAALRAAGGLAASGTDTGRYDADYSGSVSLNDVVRIARKVRGLDANP